MNDKENSDPNTDVPKLVFSNMAKPIKVVKNTRYTKVLTKEFDKVENIIFENSAESLPKSKIQRKMSEVLMVEVRKAEVNHIRKISDEDEVIYNEESPEKTSCFSKFFKRLSSLCKCKF